MGCSLSCSYFEAFSTFLHWVLGCQLGRDSVVDYLDDFLFIGPPEDTFRFDLLQAFRDMAHEFGIPLAEERTCLPST